MTITEAAQTVLKDAERAMHVDDIYDEIIRRNLYHFGAKSPKSVLCKRTVNDALVSGSLPQHTVTV